MTEKQRRLGSAACVAVILGMFLFLGYLDRIRNGACEAKGGSRVLNGQCYLLTPVN